MYKLGGFRPDPKNKIYNQFKPSLFINSSLGPQEADLRSYSSPRHNQGFTNTCVAQSVVKALEIKRIQKYGHEKHVSLSVLDLYYGARDLMFPKETDQDRGTYISLACDVLSRFGVCREEMFPFQIGNLYIPPPILATRESYLNKIKTSYKIESEGDDKLRDIVLNLQNNNPIVFGTYVDDNWKKYSINSDPLRIVKKENSLGSHAVVIVGWIKDKFIIENSWGNDWGEDGFAFIEPEVLTDPSSQDFWVIRSGSDVYFENF